jgi:Gpi18-like mannosyltransferase
MQSERRSTWTPLPNLKDSLKIFLQTLPGRFTAILRDPSLRSAGFAFFLSRAIVFFILIVATHVTLINPPEKFGRSVQEVEIRVRRTSVQDNLRMLAMRADGSWYISLAQNGYEQTPFDNVRVHNWAFFPLFPLAIRMAARLTGEYLLTAIVLSNIFFFLALIVLHKTVLAFGYDQEVAGRAVFYTAIFPAAYFFSLPWTTSLYLLTVTTGFWAAKREKWWLAGVFAAMASATHYSGIFVFPALLILYWQSMRPLKLRASVLGLLLAPAGLLVFMAYLYKLTGNAFAFAEVQSAWNVRSGLFLRPLYAFLIIPFALAEGWNFRLLNFASAVTALVCGIILLKRREPALAFFTLISIIFPLSTLTLEAHARYVIVLFPVFLVLAIMGRSPHLDQAIRAVFICLLALVSTFFGFCFGPALI